MSDETFHLTYVAFNYLEALFWIVLGISALNAGTTFKEFRKIALFTGINLVIFGMSDILEARLGSFFDPGREWLFAVKALCVLGLIASVVWYLQIRLSTPKTPE